MREVKRSALVARTPAEMFQLVSDVRSYPQFVPGCHEAVVLAQEGVESLVRLGVHRGVLRTHFTTRNRPEPPHRLHMRLEEGPFRMLEGEWRFLPAGSGGCRVEFALHFEFTNRLKAALFEPLFEHTVSDLVQAFAERARRMPSRPAQPDE
ncbi:MAG: type II toxin-antitoxin system RatA family toxin [Gammaproteobacteria bacterium]|nr:type II toxin-antitoxin system RatA family toxin [Gammaproteobacteria bacterium]